LLRGCGSLAKKVDSDGFVVSAAKEVLGDVQTR
jgi:hypothetical protein